MKTGWTWLARILNMPPRQITSLALITFLEVILIYIIDIQYTYAINIIVLTIIKHILFNRLLVTK